jgi:hypothetical protein
MDWASLVQHSGALFNRVSPMETVQQNQDGRDRLQAVEGDTLTVHSWQHRLPSTASAVLRPAAASLIFAHARPRAGTSAYATQNWYKASRIFSAASRTAPRRPRGRCVGRARADLNRALVASSDHVPRTPASS